MGSNLWMGIIPGPVTTRVMVQDSPYHTLLRARLPHAPVHPRAVETLCEAVAIWCGRSLTAAIAVEGPETSCDMKPWLDTVETITRPPLFKIHLVACGMSARDRDRLELSDLRALRRMVLSGEAR